MFVDKLQAWQTTQRTPAAVSRAVHLDQPLTPKEAAREFVAWLRALPASDRQDKYSDSQLSSLYMVFCEADDRHPASENMVRSHMKKLAGVKRKTVNSKTREGKRRRSACWVITHTRRRAQ